jgi:hypothetical protein
MSRKEEFLICALIGILFLIGCLWAAGEPPTLTP